MTYRSLLIVCLAALGLAGAGWGQADGKIAFTSWREGAGDAWIMNADGSDPVNLTQGRHAHCIRQSWSPDGTKIAYFAFSADPDSAWADYSVAYMWVMDADGGNPQQVASLPETSIGETMSKELFWAEDGSNIYYYVQHPAMNCSLCRWTAVAPHLWTGRRRLDSPSFPRSLSRRNQTSNRRVAGRRGQCLPTPSCLRSR